ncbi:glycoside hydrolase [Luteolibacter arcticus]|uniref:exo-alpha-sialidase n=2 Tax=Luteolibacter arcticus TaxID=1581411 RepID=A0ABT3GQG7_9BACT|nr:glycoside hydrolase [Luteolibacter arcticus]
MLGVHAHAGIEVSRSVVPIFNDGTESRVAEFTFEIDRLRVVKSVHLSGEGSTDFADLAEVGMRHLRKEGDRWMTETTKFQEATELDVRMEFPAGSHRCELVVKTRPGADLTHRLGLRVEAIEFVDGETMRAEKASGRHAPRFAYRIHRKGDHGCDTFRIPGLARAKDGSLLAVYDMRYESSHDLQGHMDIGLSRSTDGGKTWFAPRPILDMGEHGGKPQRENGCSDANILVDSQSGRVFVSAVWTHGRPGTHQWRGRGSEPGLGIHETSQFVCVHSDDHGVTWSEPVNLTSQLKRPEWWLFAPAPGNGITLGDGTLVTPTQGRDESGLPFSNLIVSKDHGKSWTVSAPARSDTTECAVADAGDGSLIFSMRDNRNRENKGDTNGRAVSVTRDLGATWAIHPADHGALPEPVCMASLISHRLPDGRTVLLFSNPRDKQQRRNLTIQASLDGGKTWPKEHHVLLDDGTGYGYSSLAMADDSTVGILFESSVADMIFLRVPLADIVQP